MPMPTICLYSGIGLIGTSLDVMVSGYSPMSMDIALMDVLIDDSSSGMDASVE